MLDAMREAAAHVLSEHQREWGRERALIEAQVAKILAELRAEVVTLKGELDRAVAERLSTLRDGAPGTPGAPGPKGDPGPPGRDGRLRAVTEWSGGVPYEGDLVHHGGGLWQCAADTGRPPPHEDWVCLARAGRDGRTPKVCGTWRADGHYDKLDVVVVNGGSFVAVKDNPGACPGDGWQLIARQGQRGIAGPRGERGDRGPPGPPAPFVAGWIVDKAGYSVTPIMPDGTEGPRLELRPLFKQFDDETAPP
jgi:hypothetical protein